MWGEIITIIVALLIILGLVIWIILLYNRKPTKTKPSTPVNPTPTPTPVNPTPTPVQAPVQAPVNPTPVQAPKISDDMCGDGLIAIGCPGAPLPNVLSAQDGKVTQRPLTNDSSQQWMWDGRYLTMNGIPLRYDSIANTFSLDDVGTTLSNIGGPPTQIFKDLGSGLRLIGKLAATESGQMWNVSVLCGVGPCKGDSVLQAQCRGENVKTLTADGDSAVRQALIRQDMTQQWRIENGYVRNIASGDYLSQQLHLTSSPKDSVKNIGGVEIFIGDTSFVRLPTGNGDGTFYLDSLCR